MTLDDVKKAMQKVLDRVQVTGGMPTAVLGGTDVPAHVLKGFDSTIWPVAISWLAKELDVIIPNSVHVFGGKSGGPLFNVDTSCQMVLDQHVGKPATSVAA